MNDAVLINLLQKAMSNACSRPYRQAYTARSAGPWITLRTLWNAQCTHAHTV